MPKKSSFSVSTTLLSLAAGLFLILSGSQTLVDFNSPLAQMSRGLGNLVGVGATASVVTVVLAILKIASGAFLVLEPFGVLTGVIRAVAYWVVLGTWAVFTVWSAFFVGPILKPTVLIWSQSLVLNLVVLAALGLLKPGKS